MPAKDFSSGRAKPASGAIAGNRIADFAGNGKAKPQTRHIDVIGTGHRLNDHAMRNPFAVGGGNGKKLGALFKPAERHPI